MSPPTRNQNHSRNAAKEIAAQLKWQKRQKSKLPSPDGKEIGVQVDGTK